MNEASIRDSLANNLSFIEPNLEFVGKEVSLENKKGAGGKLDILAKDQFGHFVVIEIKKSNKTAREALHELFKYVALFQASYGIGSNKCRCILISTEWHELIVPFSKFSRSAPFHVDGYQLSVDKDGIPIEKKKIELLPEGEEKYIFPIQHIFLFRGKENSEQFIGELKTTLKNCNVHNYYILTVDYQGNRSEILYRFAQYFVMYTFNLEEREKIKQELFSHDLFEDEDYEDEEYNIESTLEGKTLAKVCNSLAGYCDDMELGSSEILLNMTSKGWTVQNIFKHGSNISTFLGSDKDIVKEVTSYTGGNSSIFTSIATPKFQSSWDSVSNNLKTFLSHNRFWQAGADWFLKKIVNLSRESVVSFRIYEACGILFALYNSHCINESFLPTFEIVAQIPGEESKIIILYGFLEWNGTTFPSIESVFRDEDRFSVFMKEQIFFKVEPIHNIIMLNKHGINYFLIEESVEENGKSSIRFLSIDEEDEITFSPFDEGRFLSIENFFLQNTGYLRSLCDLGKSCIRIS